MVRVRKTDWLLAACAVALVAQCAMRAVAQDVSAPAILQMYEAKWTTIEDRMADIFEVGYGQMWLPPPQRADSGGFSVGYDVFDRFDLGSPRNETLYGTEASLKSNIAAAHHAGLSVYTDFIPNHNGFGDRTDPGFVALGGYPGFALTLPDDINGDFHDPSAGGDIEGRLAGLVDIAQEKDHQFIRQPVAEGPNNIPAGTVFNKPNPNNARFYTDQALGGLVLDDPALGGSVTRYNFNAATPLAGDPVTENAMGLLMRNAQWMIEVIGVDGFRLDAAKHMPTWVLNYLDQAVFRANPRLQHDGSTRPAFMFSEVLDGNKGFVQTFIRKDLPNPTAIDPANTTVAGNRDVLDFPLFFAMRENLSGNGFQNNWHGIRHASQDTQDDGLRNGSQGVSFVDSHDNLPGGFPFLHKVAYAYTLMRPGNAIVYLNAKEFGDNREFPHDEQNELNLGMSNDALGGFYGDAIPRLVEIRNTHGRGSFHERWIDEAFGDTDGDGQKSNVYVYERANSALVGLNNRLDAGYDERTPVQTDFAPGTVLVELTGNAADSVVDPGGDIPEAIRVDGSGQATIRIPRNDTHGRGYVIYGLAAPQGALSITGASQVLPGATPTAANNGTARLADIDVVTADTFSVRLDTTPVTLPAPLGESNPVRDFDADGDEAFVKIDGGMNLNTHAGIDITSPSDVSYGFEQFTDTRTPGYVSDGMGGNSGTGTGQYVQHVDATQLAEGRHYVTARAFRHRADGGPAVFTDFKRTIYVDRLPPEAAIVSFDAFASNPNNPNNRELIARSVDGTANNMHIFLDLPAGMTDAEILDRTEQGFNPAGHYDRGQFVLGFGGLSTGNHVATIVTFEPTGNYSIQRLPGLFTPTDNGAGFGDTDADGSLELSDIRCSGVVCNNNSVEDILYSQNAKFRATFDVNGDGLGDNRDLFALGDKLVAAEAGQAVLDSYTDLLLHRGDIDASGTTGAADIAALYSSFGSSSWLLDMNVDGEVDIADVATMITEVFRTVAGDFNVDGAVDAADYVVWRRGLSAGGATYIDGDADLDGDVDGNDLAIWQREFGFARQPLVAGSGGEASRLAVPECGTLPLAGLAMWILSGTTKARRTRRRMLRAESASCPL
jgi:alpha-amylase